ncbi:unnamed protein product [Heligmosomoides polygyrus]|uniref:Transferrin-like domain-containing protein n=1 Tax=Heligmosomoides polygyrus TaxID=6339 RepID=A0A183GPM8_HELPZ|nr:unnamed protein product [Heligmosomoides polygyrus]
MVQLNFGQISLNEYEDCSEMIVGSRDTLVLHGAQEECPLRGRYSARSCQHPLLLLGCQKPDEIQLATECNPTTTDSDLYSCAAHFAQNGDEHYLVVRDESSSQFQCMKIHTGNGVTLKLFDHVSCDPYSTNAALPSLLVNISSTERCESSLLAGFLYYSKSSALSYSLQLLRAPLFWYGDAISHDHMFDRGGYQLPSSLCATYQSALLRPSFRAFFGHSYVEANLPNVVAPRTKDVAVPSKASFT